jgi:DNA polymerase-4
MGLDEALDRVPDAQWVPTDMARAREMSGQLRAAVRREVGAIEIVGLSGFYLRAPDERNEAMELAARLEERVAERTGLPLRIGFAPARFAAPLVAEDAGRQGARLIDEGEFEDYLLSMPIERLPGVGPKTAARLAELGATDMRSLRRLGIERLEVLLGNHGRSLWLLASGEDPKPLRVKQHPKTLSREESLGDLAAVSGADVAVELEGVLRRLAEALALSLQREGLQAGRIALRLTTTPPERTETRSCSLAEPIVSAREMVESAWELLARLDWSGRTLRRIGLVLGGLEIAGAEHPQLDLF